MPPTPPFRWPIALVACVAAACGGAGARTHARRQRAPRPDELPALVTGALPFTYPAALYARKAQGDVVLQLFIDRDGRVVDDSTRVNRTSGFPGLDSAALAGAHALRFVPAKLHGEPMALSVLFPVYFRHPEARPLPGDSLLTSENRG